MQPLTPSDRVVAINTDIFAPIHPVGDIRSHPFLFPDGPLQRGVVYHVEAVRDLTKDRVGLFLTGMRVHWGNLNVSWDSSRFRKVQEAGHPPLADAHKKKVEVRIRRTPSKPQVVCSK